MPSKRPLHEDVREEDQLQRRHWSARDVATRSTSCITGSRSVTVFDLRLC